MISDSSVRAFVLLLVMANASLATGGEPVSGEWCADLKVVDRFQRRFPLNNFDESRVSQFTLPPVLSKTTTTQEDWQERREEIVELYRAHVFGRGPGKPECVEFRELQLDRQAMEGRATLKRIEVRLSNAGKTRGFELVLFVPNGPTGPLPVFLLINHRDPSNADPTRQKRAEFWPAEAVIDRGYAIAAFQASELAPDDPTTWRSGIAPLFETEDRLPPDAFGALAVWAWGASRCADYFKQDSQIDARRVAVIGHSRGGKAALWAGASDDRFALTISNESGAGGAALSRRDLGEGIARMNDRFPHWYSGNYHRLCKDLASLPVDQHLLLASMAPRAVYVASAADDLWADPRGEFLSLAHASSAFELFGDPAIDPSGMPAVESPLIRGRRGYHVRAGSHGLMRYDWDRFIDFADHLWRP